MAVAAMVARQMREQRCVNTPDESWTQEQMDLFELQRRSKATFKSDIVMEQLELNKPVVETEKKYYNVPLLFFLFILSSGLLIVGYSVYDNTKTSIKQKCLGCVLVCSGITTVLIRILFSYSPSFAHELTAIAKQKCTKLRNKQKTISNINSNMLENHDCNARY